MDFGHVFVSWGILKKQFYFIWKACPEIESTTNFLRHDQFLFLAFGNLSHCQEYCLQHYVHVFNKRSCSSQAAFPDVYKKYFVKSLLKLSEKTCTWVSSWLSCRLPACNFFEKDETQMFSCKCYDIFKNTFFRDVPLEWLLQNFQAKEYV